MTTATRVTAAPAAAPAPKSAPSTRATALGQEHAVEGVPQSSFVSRFDRTMDFQSGGQGGARQQQRESDPYTVYLNGVGKFASGWIANQTEEDHPQGEGGGFLALLSETLRGVGIYESNLRVVAGTYRTVGRSLSFYL